MEQEQAYLTALESAGAYQWEQSLVNEPADNTPPAVITVSVDEKPGVQAIGTVAPDLPPK
ncbi:MAG: hypothetical protein HF973_09050, partial [Chloroflexi bacterium]|nr:hypothetical protein [Chloroflexota bacterium]